MPPDWKLLGVKTEFSTPIFTLQTRRAASALTGRAHDFYVLDTSDWVNVVPITQEGELLLIRQFRHGIGRATLEIPGGLIEPGETPEQAAGRELIEETGHVAGKLELLGRVRPNPAIMNNWCYTFLAEDVVFKEEAKGDGVEELDLVRAPLGRVPALVASGEIDHALVLSAFYHLLAREPGVFQRA